MTDPGPAEDWEIWTGSSLALVIRKADPDKPWLTRVMSLKYQMPGVLRSHALLVFTRALSRGYLIPLPHHAAPTEGDTDAP
ncbi:MAG: hypothetical protein Q8L48_16665 [Archangium sp.]|nr:hypothetical protein [Archangium sp.]